MPPPNRQPSQPLNRPVLPSQRLLLPNLLLQNQPPSQLQNQLQNQPLKSQPLPNQPLPNQLPLNRLPRLPLSLPHRQRRLRHRQLLQPRLPRRHRLRHRQPLCRAPATTQPALPKCRLPRRAALAARRGSGWLPCRPILPARFPSLRRFASTPAPHPQAVTATLAQLPAPVI